MSEISYCDLGVNWEIWGIGFADRGGSEAVLRDGKRVQFSSMLATEGKVSALVNMTFNVWSAPIGNGSSHFRWSRGTVIASLNQMPFARCIFFVPFFCASETKGFFAQPAQKL